MLLKGVIIIIRKCYHEVFQTETLIESYHDMEEYSDYLVEIDDLSNSEEYEHDEFNELIEKVTYDEEMVDCYIYMGELEYL